MQLQASGFDPALQKRALSAAVLAFLALASVWLGGWAFALLVVIAIFGMAWELGHLLPGPSAGAFRASIAAAALIPSLAVVLVTLREPRMALLTIGLGAVAIGLLAAALRVDHAGRIGAGVAYIGIPAVALTWLDAVPEDGWLLVLWLLLVVWATDIFAYAVGRMVGGARLAPSISPGKTWSGLAGGVLGAVLVGAAASHQMGGRPILAALLAAMLAVIGQIGDLYESSLKRQRGVKDSGRSIPGHGGILDRLDSLLFAAPVYALAVVYAQPVVLS